MSWQESGKITIESALLALFTLAALLALLLVASLAGAAPENRPEAAGAFARRAFLLATRTVQPTPVTAGAIVLASTIPAPLATPVPAATATRTPAAPATAPPAAPPTAGLGPPLRIRIPQIAVDAAIQPIGVTAANEMEIPQAPDLVGWYRYGPRPGESGNAVLAGHLDTSSGAPAVFWRLKELRPGDTIEIDSDGRSLLLYRVDSVVSYPYDQAPLAEIFSAAGPSGLTLITCSGAWHRTDANYDQRLVVSAHLDENSAQMETGTD